MLLTSAWEALRNASYDIGRRPFASALSMAAMGLALFLMAIFIIGNRGLNRLFGELGSDAVIEIYLDRDASAFASNALEQRLRDSGHVRRLEQVSSARALEEFVALYPDLGSIRQLLPANPFPPSLRVWPAESDPAAIDSLAAIARSAPAVESVRFDREWIEALSKLSRAFGTLTLIGAAVIALAAWTIVGSVIRIALEDKRDEVALLRLVGASPLFSLAPVLLSGSIMGGVGGLLAVGAASWLSGAGMEWASATPLASFTTLLLGHGLTSLERVLLVGAGTLSGALSAILSLKVSRKRGLQ